MITELSYFHRKSFWKLSVTLDESAWKRISRYRITNEKDRVCVALLANFTCLIVSFISVESYSSFIE